MGELLGGQGGFLLLVGFHFVASQVRIPLGPYFPINRHVYKVIRTSFLESKVAIRISLFLLLLDASLSSIDRVLLLHKEQQGGRRRRPDVSTRSGKIGRAHV